jgi:YbgC/YbaW family acyl-CoA thioester hydrolase
MGRTKVDLPEDFSFQTTIPIRITDVNYGGHVGNDTVLTLLHEARMQFLKHHGFSEMDFGGVGLIMSDVIIEFKKEIFYGEEVTIFVNVSNFNRIGFDVFYMVVKSQQELVVAKAKTGMVCYDYKLKKIVSVPETALQSFK